MNARKILLATVAANLLLPAIPALAEQQVEEVVVTARKREESIMKVPVVETALNRQQLEQYAVGGLQGISNQVPGLLIGAGESAFGTQVSLRGVGTSTLNATVDQSVSLNVDGMQMTQGSAYAMAMFDMASVQVMKGPQALFYGKASPGGVIAIKTNDPTDQYDVILRGGYEFEARTKEGEVILSGPLTDTLRVRLAGKYSSSDGFFKNAAVGQQSMTVALPFPPYSLTFPIGAETPKYDRVPNNETTMLRGTAIWEPIDRFKARLKVNYAKSDTQGSGGQGQFTSCPDGTTSSVGIQFLGGGENCVLDRTMRVVDLDPAAFPKIPGVAGSGVWNNGVPFETSEQAFGTLEMNYDLTDALTVTSVTGYYHILQKAMINGTETTYAAPPYPVQTNFTRRDFTQELRLTSNFTDIPVNFTLGAFYQDGKMHLLANLPVNQDYIALGIPLPPVIQAGYNDIGIQTISFFGQVLWDITPKLELGAGTRWTKEDRSDTQTNLSPYLGIPVGITPLLHPRIGSNKFSPEFTLTYKPTDDLTVFGSLKQAYKSGSFATSEILGIGGDNSFGDERVRAVEAGIKSRWLDRTLQVDVAGYYNRFRGLQVGANEVTNTGELALRTINAGTADIYGVDLDVTYLPPQIDGLTLRGAVNWNHARYGTFDNAQCWGGQRIQDGCDLQYDSVLGTYTAQNLSGKPLMRAPDWSANFGFDYSTAFANDMMLTIGSMTTYSSSYYTNVLLRSDMLQKGYFKTNLSVTLMGPNDGWEVAVVANNLTNELTSSNCVNANFQDGNFPTVVTGATYRGPGGVEELWCTVDPGREVWLRVTLKPLELLNQ